MTETTLDWLTAHYRTVNAASAMDPPMPMAESRDLNEHWGDATAEPGGVDYLEVDAGGVPAMWAAPEGAADDRVLLCVHGGGFIAGSMYTHRKMFGHLARAAGVRALIAGYRLAPEHRHPAQVDDTTGAYAWLLEQGFRPDRLAVAGDSAGGGLAVQAMLHARDRGLPVAAGVMPLSPWFDLENGGETRTTNVRTDALFGGETPMNLDFLTWALLGEHGDPTDPSINVLYADLTGLPPMYIQAGGIEMILDDGLRLAALAEKAGVEVTVEIFEGEQHTWHMGAGRSPAADEAIRKLAAWVRPRLGLG
ncbi:esterase [Sphaerisporangium rufum]|uniref:Esterase n=1 Tax=Sphaerisporangium rufum TaxID=1381558 RepID=A0A919UYY3_9ACTN|nr:alpha/beta hydrolase [Sphaerisporangium rufum]GII78521.1 esterase [Sphaerisporangium rufum]